MNAPFRPVAHVKPLDPQDPSAVVTSKGMFVWISNSARKAMKGVG